MEFREFQEYACKTDQNPTNDPEGLVIPILGLLGEAGNLATVYKKYLRDGIPWESNQNFIKQELGDLLWYISTIATHCGLDLNDIANSNISRAADRYGYRGEKWADKRIISALDSSFPDTERFPRRMSFYFREDFRDDGEKIATMSIVSAVPNYFPNGAMIDSPSGKKVGFCLGSPLTNNSRTDDGYRYHDAIHVAFLAVLGWSPVMRDLLRLKRKSDPSIDECEDGARAVDVEEGISSLLAKRAPDYNFFQESRNVDNDTLDIVLEHAKDLEVAQLPAWLWRNAISSGFQSLSFLKENGGGYLHADLDSHSLTWTALITDPSLD